jgi:hypothetical protein
MFDAGSASTATGLLRQPSRAQIATGMADSLRQSRGGSASDAVLEPKHRDRRHHARQAGEDEGRQIARERVPGKAGAERGCCGAQLVRHEDPAEHDGTEFTSEGLTGNLDRRGNGRDPVQTVEDSEYAEPVEREVCVGQQKKAEAAQAVVPEKQPTPGLFALKWSKIRDGGSDS